MAEQRFGGGMVIEVALDPTRPQCPCCERELDKNWIKKKGLGWIEQQKVLMRPSCRALRADGTFSWS